jgi:hypothetical protein
MPKIRSVKTYVTYWYCKKCQILLELHSWDKFMTLTETGPLCSECASHLKVFDGNLNAPCARIVIDFSRSR